MPLIVGLFALLILSVGGAWFLSGPSDSYTPEVAKTEDHPPQPQEMSPESKHLLEMARYLERNPQVISHGRSSSPSSPLDEAVKKTPALANREQEVLRALGNVTESERAIILWGLTWNSQDSAVELELRKLLEHTDQPHAAALEVALRLPSAESPLRRYLLFYGIHHAEIEGRATEWKAELKERAERMPAEETSRADLLDVLDRSR